jgi:hypothetical protein
MLNSTMPTDCNPWATSAAMQTPTRKPLMRSLGEFVGHIIRAVKTDPARKVIHKSIDEQQQDSLILRRTTIDEVEIKK